MLSNNFKFIMNWSNSLVTNIAPTLGAQIFDRYANWAETSDNETFDMPLADTIIEHMARLSCMPYVGQNKHANNMQTIRVALLASIHMLLTFHKEHASFHNALFRSESASRRAAGVVELAATRGCNVWYKTSYVCASWLNLTLNLVV